MGYRGRVCSVMSGGGNLFVPTKLTVTMYVRVYIYRHAVVKKKFVINFVKKRYKGPFYFLHNNEPNCIKLVDV